MSTIIYAMAPSDERANTIVNALKSAGFTSTDLSMLCPLRHSLVAGNVVACTRVTVVGVGDFLAAGPILALLSAPTLRANGGMADALILLGMPARDAQRYQSKICGDGIFIAVQADNYDWMQKAKQVLRDAGGEDIGSSVGAATTVLMPPSATSTVNHSAAR